MKASLKQLKKRREEEDEILDNNSNHDNIQQHNLFIHVRYTCKNDNRAFKGTKKNSILYYFRYNEKNLRALSLRHS